MVQHCDDETLSLLALGEPASAAVSAHLSGCSRCAHELATLRTVVDAARDAVPLEGMDLLDEMDLLDRINLPEGVDATRPGAVLRVAPPPRVWAQIAAATGVTTQARQDEVLGNADAVPTLTRPRSNRSSSRSRASRRARTSNGRRLMLAAVSAALIVGLLGGVLGDRLLNRPGRQDAQQVVLAATDLSGLALAPGAVGRADVVQTAQGRQLDLAVKQLGTPSGFYEVWLIDPTITKMVAIGVLSGSKGKFSLPQGVSLAAYPLVDISIQPLDGDPKHSGRSVLRGTLRS